MDLFEQSLTIMTLGMTLVFLFLFVVIQCMNFTAYLIRRHEAAHPEAGADDVEAGSRSRLAAAIAAALDHPTNRAN